MVKSNLDTADVVGGELAQHDSQVVCHYCGIDHRAKPLDLDVAHDPPVLSCRKCLRKPICTSCNRRAGRVVLPDNMCCRCVRKSNEAERKRRLRPCSTCGIRFDVLRLSTEKDQCSACGFDSLTAEYPEVFAAMRKR